ncbi:hypothetical protein NUW54_g9388 [Trametes sanguinea]|uniref:Uncharacterized protein n=1 Tax=Trametes sanguinea TaxID=158606 RepID=A0ACC1P946_9APHY|nr:hypothetical protein NUW54_g9388 [Trametes sanguinea]
MHESCRKPTTARTSRLRPVSMEGHQPLQTLTGDDYIRAFLQIYIFLCWRTGIRHGVWTPDDLTYLRAQDGSIQGMLHDWDILVDSSGQFANQDRFPATPPSPNFVPFMAIDLLTPEGLEGDVAVLYRHELESFIWVLIWAVCCYHNGMMIRSAPDEMFDWDVRKPLVCGTLKLSFLVIGMAIKPAPDGWVYGAKLAYYLASYLRRKDSERATKREAAYKRWQESQDELVNEAMPSNLAMFVCQEDNDPEGAWNEFWTYLGKISRLVPCVAEFMPVDLRKAGDADHLKQSTTAS